MNNHNHYAPSFEIKDIDFCISKGRLSKKLTEKILNDKNIKIKKLEQENKMMRECLEFYAKLDSWENYSDDIYPCHIKIKDDSDPQFNYTGGFRARKVLNNLLKKDER
jgi:hypothetical protein